ncbi:endolytic transglycosylase MltG [Crocinitomicaceae bacterium]|nr:endolytic transglycosylase MltG [Crocinitomicaceae bacterium]
MLKKLVLFGFIALVGLALMKFEKVKALFSEEIIRTTNATQTKLLIPTDPTFIELLDMLQAKGVIGDVNAVRGVAVKQNLDTTNFAGGKYLILSGTRIEDLIAGFQKNSDGLGRDEIMVKVSFNYCRDIYDVGSAIEKCIVADSASIVEGLLDPYTHDKYNLNRDEIAGLFLPRQYEMPFDTDAKQFISFMGTQYETFWTEGRMSKMRSIGLNVPSEVTTLASIVYAEQGRVKNEWPIIAKLYLNRLDKGMRLESDPTFKFCWGSELDNVQRLTYKHRDIDCAHNTYKISGLPPGPICIPPAGVIDAVLNPAAVDWTFMCAQANYSGEHNFTASVRAHQNNANKYQRWLKNEIKKKDNE